MICAARNEAHGSDAESWAEGRERREYGADDRCPCHKLGSLRASGASAARSAVSPAQPRQRDVYLRKKVVAIRAVESGSEHGLREQTCAALRHTPKIR
jgi:hypothetical protein